MLLLLLLLFKIIQSKIIGQLTKTEIFSFLCFFITIYVNTFVYIHVYYVYAFKYTYTSTN